MPSAACGWQWGQGIERQADMARTGFVCRNALRSFFLGYRIRRIVCNCRFRSFFAEGSGVAAKALSLRLLPKKGGTMFSGKLCFLHGQGKEVCLYAKASQKEQACHHCSQEIPDSACNGLGHLHGPLYFWESKSPVSARFLNRAINLAITALPSRTAMNTSIA